MKEMLVLLMLTGCVACTNLPPPNKNLVICENKQCNTPATDTQNLLPGLRKILQGNNGKASICSANANQHHCQKNRVCYFVLGGILPGNGCATQITLSNIQSVNAYQLKMQADMPLKFIGTPVKCKSAKAYLTSNSENQTLSLTLSPHFCSWMVMGVMTAQLDFHIDWIDLDSYQIGGYWAHSVKGTGNGRGSGYMILTFSDQ